MKHPRHHPHHDHLARRLFGSGPAPTAQQLWDGLHWTVKGLVLLAGAAFVGLILGMALVGNGVQFN